MELLRRRHQLAGETSEPAIEIIHPQWWHIKFTTTTENQVVLNFNNYVTFSVKETVVAPDGAKVLLSDRNIVADKVGTYEIYFTISVSSNTAMYYGWNCPYYCRLPKPYASNGYLRPVYGFGPGGNTQRNKLDIYLINDTPPVGPNNTALGGIYSNVLVSVYVPKGSIQNYVNNANTRWKAMYDAGRLTEVNYTMIED